MYRIRRRLHTGAQLPLFLQYSVVLFLNLVALLLTWLLFPFVQRSIFIFFFATLAINTWIWGLASAIFTILFALVAVSYFFIPPAFSLNIGIEGSVPLVVFASVALLITGLTEARKRAEQKARTEGSRFRVTLTSIGDAVIVTDTTSRVSFINPVAEELTGWTQAEAIGKDHADIFWLVNEDTLQPVESPVARVLREGRVVGVANHTRLIARNGVERPIADSGAPIRDADGKILGVVMVFRDITERVQAEQARTELLERERQARVQAEQALHLRDQFLSLASHELKTPLTAILGNLELFQRRIKRENSLSERDQRTVQVIVGQTERLNKMVMSLLDISRIETGQLLIERRSVDVAALVNRVVSETQLSLGEREVRLQLPTQPVVVQGDELRLEQVFQNLIQNAHKYSEGVHPIEILVGQDADQVCVNVSDRGIGIPHAALNHLFDRFYRASNVEHSSISGMGIGLYVVKEIVGLHGGEVAVESIEGVGSTFRVCLPVNGSAAE